MIKKNQVMYKYKINQKKEEKLIMKNGVKIIKNRFFY